jgi:hypothetical protein
MGCFGEQRGFIDCETTEPPVNRSILGCNSGSGVAFQAVVAAARRLLDGPCSGRETEKIDE